MTEESSRFTTIIVTGFACAAVFAIVGFAIGWMAFASSGWGGVAAVGYAQMGAGAGAVAGALLGAFRRQANEPKRSLLGVLGQLLVGAGMLVGLAGVAVFMLWLFCR